MSECNGVDANAEAANKRLISKLKAQRVQQNANTLVILAESLLNRVEDDGEVKVKEEELDQINKEIVDLQDRLIKAV